MKFSAHRRRLTAALLLVALGATACGGGDNGGTAGSSAPKTGGSFSLYVNDPENPLVPGNTTESEGNQILKGLFTGLVQYDLKTTEVAYTGVAKSVESTDQKNWTITLKDGWTFHDGTPVTADSFVKAWNYTANAANAQGGAYFFEKFAGYDAKNPVEALTGLTAKDDKTITVQLSAPFSQFPLMLGYTAFYPLPEAFYANKEAFGKKPIGNGPYKADGDFVPGQGVTLSRYADYAGEDKGIADTIQFRVFADINTAYNELLAGNLDVVDSLPTEVLQTAQQDLGERFLSREAAGFDYMGFPTYDPRYADKRVRQAFSLAVDRGAITKAIFNGQRDPATDVIPPVIDGYRADACKYCTLDVARAKQLLKESGFDTSRPVELWFNAGAGHDQWVTAVGNQLQQNLGVTYTLKGDLQFAQYLPLQDQKGMTGPFRLGWGMDYPSPENFLGPLFSTGALPPNGSNSSFYSNPAFDAKLQEANQASDNEQAVKLYQQADDIMLEDMPVMPMFFRKTTGARSEKVTNVQFDAFQDVALTKVQPNNG